MWFLISEGKVSSVGGGASAFERVEGRDEADMVKESVLLVAGKQPKEILGAR